MLEAVANDDGSTWAKRALHAAEQDLLLVRLAADSGARRGELVALQLSDRAGRVLTMARAVSGDGSGRPSRTRSGA